MKRWVALLRAVNVGGRKVPMAALREVATSLGWDRIETFIQSGNLLFDASGGAAALEVQLEEALDRRFGIAVPVIVRSGRELGAALAGNPFARAAIDEPNRLMLLMSKKPAAPGAERALAERAAAGERVGRAGGDLWIHYPAGAGRSKLTPSAIDKAVGSAATARNHRTITKLAGMATA